MVKSLEKYLFHNRLRWGKGKVTKVRGSLGPYLYPKQLIFSVKMVDEIILVDDNSSSAQLRKDLNLKPKFKLYEMFICIQNALKENL